MNYKNYIIKNRNGLSVKILELGGIIAEINVPDREGNFRNIVLGFENISEYEQNDAYFGAIIGRTGGRINKGRFSLNGEEFYIQKKDRGNALHGGIVGFDKRIWKVKEIYNGLELSYFSHDGEEGFPGNVTAKVKYILNDDNTLELNYEATTDKDTVLNLTNHSYLCLDLGETILNQKLFINSDKLFELDETSIPTGEFINVEGTPFDFRKEKKIGDDIEENHIQLIRGCGYDHPWLLNKSEEKQVGLYDSKTGRKVTMYSDQNAVVVYSYNFPINNHKKHIGLAVEFQNDPDGINHEHFNSSILKKGEVYRQKTVYKFEVD